MGGHPRAWCATGATLLLTTQYLEEADALADRIAVVDAGRIIARGTADELKSQVGGERVEVVVHEPGDLAPARDVLARRLRGRRRGRRAHPPADRSDRAAAPSSWSP